MVIMKEGTQVEVGKEMSHLVMFGDWNRKQQELAESLVYTRRYFPFPCGLAQ